MRNKMTMGVIGGLVAAVSLLLNGCATQAPRHSGVVKVSKEICPYQIHPLDRAQLTFADGSNKELIVTQEGTVNVTTGTQKVQGLPVDNFKALLEQEFPAVTNIEIKEFKDNRISVLGEVFHHIHTDFGNGPMRLMDAIASANGFTPLADKQHVRLVRENAGMVETYEIDFKQLLRGENMSQNILIEPGDIITVPRNFL